MTIVSQLAQSRLDEVEIRFESIPGIRVEGVRFPLEQSDEVIQRLSFHVVRATASYASSDADVTVVGWPVVALLDRHRISQPL